jgi:hypothetical protein
MEREGRCRRQGKKMPQRGTKKMERVKEGSGKIKKIKQTTKREQIRQQPGSRVSCLHGSMAVKRHRE